MKKILFIALAAFVLLAACTVPVKHSVEKDGTRVYTALAYRIVDWNIPVGDSLYSETDIYWFPQNFSSIDSLYAQKLDTIPRSFTATVISLSESTMLVEPVEGQWECQVSDRISVQTLHLPKLQVEVGDYVKLTYTGGIQESYPAQIRAIDLQIATDLRHVCYQEVFVDANSLQLEQAPALGDLVITKIYANCFFANTVIPMPYEIKLNGSVSEQWCVGDQVFCTYENAVYDGASGRIEADLVTIEQGTFELDPFVCYKPVIYLYPEETTAVSVKLQIDGELTCTYPAYADGWQVTAAPDGTLTDERGQTYQYLYWEGTTNAQWNMDEGVCVAGAQTAQFLETALEQLGLNRREANEFIVYWLPLMEQNPYNIIAFQTDVYTQAAQLEILPQADTLIRVFMAWQPSECYVAIPSQQLKTAQREGFTVVEWGGTRLPA